MHCDGLRILEGVLALEGIDQSEIHIEEQPFELDRLLKSDFDAVQGYAMTEPLELKAMGVDVRTIAVRHHRLHPYAQVFFAAQSIIETRQTHMESFLRTSFEGWRQAMQHRDDAARTVTRLAGAGTDADMERHIIDTIQSFLAGPVGMDCYGMLDLRKLLATFQTCLTTSCVTSTSVESSALAPKSDLAMCWSVKSPLRVKLNSHQKSVYSVPSSVRRLAKFATPHSRFLTVKVAR